MSDRTPRNHETAAGAPASPARRQILLGLGAASGGAVIGALMPVQAATCPFSGQTAPLPAGPTIADRQPFLGLHQSGITTPRQAAGLVVSLDVLATTSADLQRLFRTLTQRIEFLVTGGAAPVTDPKFPPPESGLLGPHVAPDNLTMTVAVGASLFDQRFGLRNVVPVQLTAMPQFPNDALDDDICHGDILLQICSNTAETNIHALRDVMKNLPDLLMIRWTQDGFVPTAREPGETKESPRNLLGFKDGTANPDAADGREMDRIVWVQPDAREPAWAKGGSYQVVRIIRNFVERWDRTPLQEQQTIIGRDKPSGAPLGMKAERDLPDYSADPEGARLPLDAHIRLANPRTAQTQANLILRRPFNYSRGVTASGQLDMGLLFICFQSDLKAGFVTVQNRLNGEPLEEYIKPVGGGYFFALPGVPAKGGYLGQPMLEAAGYVGASDQLAANPINGG